MCSKGCCMSNGIFSNFQVNSAVNSTVATSPMKSDNQNSKKSAVMDTVKTVAPIVIPLAAIPVTAIITHKMSSKNIEGLKDEIKNLSRDIAKLEALQDAKNTIVNEAVNNQDKASKKANALLWSAVIGLTGYTAGKKVDELSDDDKQDIAKAASTRYEDITSKTSEALNAAQQSMTLSNNSLSKKYMANVNGVQLMQNSDSLNKNAQKYEAAIAKIKTAAPHYLHDKPEVNLITKENPSIWSVTSEFAPIKEGGLGSVPVEIQNNVAKLGIDIPTFIPMYQQKGIASFKQEGDKYTYTYKGKEYDLKKAAEFKVDSFRGGKSSSQDVEVYVSTTQDKDGNQKQLVFIKNDNYFNGTIYQTSERTEEPEKFAFFSKAVYEFAKAKEDASSVKDLKITDTDAFNSVKSPDAMILNDWQASPIAALARYKAPMENAYSQLSDAAAEKLSNLNLITIGHNTMYQGSTRNNNDNPQRCEATTNILNTLFDSFTYDIVSNATTGASETNPTDSGLANLDNVLLLNQNDGNSNHTNLLNMGVCLSNYFNPVSKNYAKEIISDEHPELAAELRWAVNQKTDAGAVEGIINGNDFHNLSIEAKKGQIKAQTRLDYKTYNKQSEISDIMAARTDNKIKFYNDFMLPFSKVNNPEEVKNSKEVADVKALTGRLEFVENKRKTTLPEISDTELAKTPVISSVGRLVSQKGINVMSDAIKMLFDNWEKDFPGKPKPLFYIAGQDAENGQQRRYVEDLKDNRLSEEDSNRVVFAHGFAPMTAITAASDFFLLPSIFEPCGLTQGESFAVATPVIGSAVGGIVDTVNRDGKTNGILTNQNESLSAKGFYEAMKKGLDVYFNNPEQYQKMVNDSLGEDFSWIQKGKQGPVYDYLEKLGISRNTTPDVA